MAVSAGNFYGNKMGSPPNKCNVSIVKSTPNYELEKSLGNGKVERQFLIPVAQSNASLGLNSLSSTEW
ncbi:hypothetical protein MRX96_052880 [Rhipicephalus microplus]